MSTKTVENFFTGTVGNERWGAGLLRPALSLEPTLLKQQLRVVVCEAKSARKIATSADL